MEQPRKRHKKNRNPKAQHSNDAKRDTHPKASKSKLERISPPREEFTSSPSHSCSCFRVTVYILLLSLTTGGAFCTWYMWDDGIGSFVQHWWSEARVWYKGKFQENSQPVKSENEFEEAYSFYKSEDTNSHKPPEELYRERLKSFENDDDENIRNDINNPEVDEFFNEDSPDNEAEFESLPVSDKPADEEYELPRNQEFVYDAENEPSDEQDRQKRDIELSEFYSPEAQDTPSHIAEELDLDQVDSEELRNRETVTVQILEELQKQSYKIDGGLQIEKINEVPNLGESLNELDVSEFTDEVEGEVVSENYNLPENDFQEYSEAVDNPPETTKVHREEKLDEDIETKAEEYQEVVETHVHQEVPLSVESRTVDPKDDVAAFASRDLNNEIPLDIIMEEIKVQKYEDVKKAKEQNASKRDEKNQSKVITNFSETKSNPVGDQVQEEKKSNDSKRGLRLNESDDKEFKAENLTVSKSSSEDSRSQNDIVNDKNVASDLLQKKSEGSKIDVKADKRESEEKPHKSVTGEDGSLKALKADGKSTSSKTTEENNFLKLAEFNEQTKKLKQEKMERMKAYKLYSITNELDYEIRKDLDSADGLLKSGKFDEALKKFQDLFSKYPNSPRAIYGKGLAYNGLAEQEQSNHYLELSINELEKILDLPDVPDSLFRKAGELLVDRSRFRGFLSRTLNYQRRLVSKFPEETSLQNQMGVTYLLLGQEDDAKQVLEKVLKLDPENGFAKVHLGFILKTHDGDIENGVRLMREGIESKAAGTDSGRFYYHLGDGLQRLNKTKEAYEVYEEGAKKGHFLSAYQRSLYNVNSLIGRPWWTPEQTTYQKYLKLLEDNWHTIREEGLAQMDPSSGMFTPESEDLSRLGEWKQYTLYSQGRKWGSACKRTPTTCALIDQIPDASGCKRGQVKFSVMQPGTYVWPHTGPTNCRLRSHLGLVVPSGSHIRVANETRTWQEGKFIIFDDSFEHEVWHDGSKFRLILIVDFWHPDLTDHQKWSLTPI